MKIRHSIASLMLASSVLAADLSLDVAVNRSQVYLGESVILTVKVDGDMNPPAPDLSAIKGCSVESLGSRSQSITSMTLVNGRLRRTGFHGCIFIYALTPTAEGRFRAGPVVLEAKGKTVRAEGPTIEVVGPVRVVPPPEEGRPPVFIGAVGPDMQVDASLDTQTCNVGDPLKLTIRISGDVNLENVTPPVLAVQTNLAARFRTYDDTVEAATRNGAREYTYTIRPTVAGTFEVPPIELAYFDTDARLYKTAASKPIPIRANEVAQVGHEIVIATDTNGMAEELAAPTAATLVLAPLDVNAAGAFPRSLGMEPWHKAVCILAPLLYVLGVTVRYVRPRLPGLCVRRARHGALREAVAELRALSGDDARAVSSGLCHAVTGYIARRFGVAGQGLTPPDAVQILEQHGIPHDLAGRLGDLHQRNFDAAFASAAASGPAASDDLEEARKLLHEIDSTLGPRRKTSARSALPALLGAVLVPALLCAGNTAERQFMWNEANARLATAQTEDELLQAAAGYRALAEAGVKNGPLFYNFGTAMLRAGRHDQAIALLLRAERYAGSNEDIKRNMLLAIAGRDAVDQPALPWYRALLFWHFGLELSTRIGISVCAFAGAWLALLMRMFGRRRLAVPLLAVSLTALALFGSSAATTSHQEAAERLDAVEIGARAPQEGAQ